MTLHRHQSDLIPDVQYSLAGGLFITDRDGTFPLRATKHRKGEPTPDYDDGTYRSYDPKRLKGKFRKRGPSKFQEEMDGGTWSSYRGSLSRRPHFKRSSSYRVSDEKRFGTWGSGGSGGSTSLKRNLRRGQIPKMPKNYNSGSLQRFHSYSSTEAKKARKELRDFHDKTLNANSLKAMEGKLPLIIEESGYRHRKMADDPAPSLLFVIGGLLLLAAGAVKTILCPWHEYFASLWTGALVIK